MSFILSFIKFAFVLEGGAVNPLVHAAFHPSQIAVVLVVWVPAMRSYNV